MALLGIKSGILNPESYERKQAYNRKWCQTHRAANRSASARYRQRIQAAMGSKGDVAKWQFGARNKARKLQLRKELLNAIEKKASKLELRKLVEGFHTRHGRRNSRLHHR